MPGSSSLRVNIMDEESKASPPNTSNYYEVSHKDLPLHCPMPGMSLWNSHPRVYLAIEKTGDAKCAYCGAVFRLVEHPAETDAA